MRSTLRCCHSNEEMRCASLIPLGERRKRKNTRPAGSVNVSREA
jgi:hypothetical protein